MVHVMTLDIKLPQFKFIVLLLNKSFYFNVESIKWFSNNIYKIIRYFTLNKMSFLDSTNWMTKVKPLLELT